MSEKEEFEKLPVGMPKWMREHLELYLSDPDKAYLWDSTIGGGPGPLPTLLLIARGAVESEGKEDDGGQTVDVGALFRRTGASSSGPTSNPDDRQIAQRRQRFRAIILSSQRKACHQGGGAFDQLSLGGRNCADSGPSESIFESSKASAASAWVNLP